MKSSRPSFIQNIENDARDEGRVEAQPTAKKAELVAGKDVAHIARKMIRLSHGSTKLNFGAIARELGVEVRTLQRYFREAFGLNMKQYTVQTRMEFAQRLLSQEPSPKVSFVASRLGYETDRGFLRFVAERTEGHRSGAKPRKPTRRAVQLASDEALEFERQV